MNVKISIVVSSLIATILTSPAVAQKPSKNATTTDVMTTKKIEYVLPYPGILPDHSLYFLKQVRDKILDFLIVDTVRKAEFYVLQADKRLGMGMMLLDKSNGALAEATMSKGENYMERAISLLVNLKASGKEIPGYLIDRLERSLDKHVEVLSDRVAKESGAAKGALVGLLERAKKLQSDVAKTR